MRIVLFSLLPILIGSTNAQADAQSASSGLELSASVGIVQLLDPTASASNNGYSVGGQIAYCITPRFAIGGTGMYSLVGPFGRFGNETGSWDYDNSLLELTAFGRLLIADYRPGGVFAKIAAGTFRLRTERRMISPQPASRVDTERTFALGGGFGVQFPRAASLGGFFEVLLLAPLPGDGVSGYVSVRAGVSVFPR